MIAAIGSSVTFLLAALLVVLLPSGIRRGAWLSIHLALAGGASTAIAGVLPYFAAAFGAAPPASRWLRPIAVGAVALGALGVSVGVVAGWPALAAGGGAGFVVGIVLTGVCALQPLGGRLGPVRGLLTPGYLIALAEVGLGAAIATLYVAGWTPLVERWGSLKPAHAWLNLVGFVSVVIATTLLHLFPTVVGARIVRRRSSLVTVAGLGGGTPLVALGFALGADPLARVGALVFAAGALGLALDCSSSWLSRSRWTTDSGWHWFAIGGLVSAVAWFEVGIAMATSRVLAIGAGPAAWSVDLLIGPLIVGWIVLTIVASATHLIPAIGPGGPLAHGRQRRVLGIAAVPRLTILNLGVAWLSAGLAFDLVPLAMAGVTAVALGLASTAFLGVRAIRVVRFGDARHLASGR